MMERWVFLNGQICLEQDAKIPINDRGFLFGEGIFTTIRVRQGKCEFLQSHLKRLEEQAKNLNFDISHLQFDWISKIIQYNKAYEGIWRLKNHPYS